MGPVDTGLSTGLRDVARPVSMAGERLLSVREPLGALLPEPGLRRGAVVAVSGSTSLVLALAAEATTGGSWCAAAGLGSLGLVAAAELGVALERLVLVSSTDSALWPTVTATLLDAFDVVLARPPRHLRAADARRLAARARERGAVLVVSGGEWPERADVRMAVTRTEWQGLERGHGRHRRGHLRRHPRSSPRHDRPARGDAGVPGAASGGRARRRPNRAGRARRARGSPAPPRRPHARRPRRAAGVRRARALRARRRPGPPARSRPRRPTARAAPAAARPHG